jgi:hypothetical protein
MQIVGKRGSICQDAETGYLGNAGGAFVLRASESFYHLHGFADSIMLFSIRRHHNGCFL